MTASSRPPLHPGFRLIGEADGELFDFILQPGESRAGASSDNDLVIRIAGVSDRHALLGIDADGMWLRDLGSKNGTFVNGQRVEDSRVRVGDIVCIGPVSLRLVAIDAEDAAIAVEGRDPVAPKKPNPQRWSRSKTPTGTDTP